MVPGAGGAGEDGVLEGFWFNFARGAGQVCVLVQPGGVGGQVALRHRHLVNSPGHERLESHEGVWREGRGVLVVGGCGVISDPISEEHVSGAGQKGLIRPAHEVWGGNIRSRWAGGVPDEREMCEAYLQGQGEVCQGVNREVSSYRWRENFRPPVKGEVHRREALCEVPRRVLGPEGREGGEGLWESG